MNEKTKIRRGSLFFAICVAILALFCVLAGACSAKDDDGNKNSPEQTIVAPDIMGPAGQTVLEGYSSFSSEKFIVSGDNVSVSITESGSTQYVRDNPFWDLRDDIDTILNEAIELTKEYGDLLTYVEMRSAEDYG